MGMMSRIADRMLARIVPEVAASACKESTWCYRYRDGCHNRTCYVGCGRPTFCRKGIACGPHC